MKNVFLTIIICSLCLTPSRADTIIVDLAGGGDYTSIHEAVQAAQDGDEILVMSGTYIFTVGDGVVSVNKELDIVGSGYDLPANGGTTINAPANIFDFVTGSDGSLLRGFRLIGAAASMVQIASPEVVIEENLFQNQAAQGFNVYITSGVGDTLRNNIFTNGPNAAAGSGIGILSTTDALINNNIFGSTYYGVATYNNTNLKIVNNVFLDVVSIAIYNGGAAWNYTDNALISNNIIMNCATGIGNAGSGSPTISYNGFYNNSSNGMEGISPKTTSPVFVDYGSNDDYDFGSYDNDGYDLRLQGTSTYLDAGDPLVTFNDLDGSRNDLGAYGWIYPIGTTGAPTIPVVNSISVTPTTVSPSGTITINATGRIGD